MYQSASDELINWDKKAVNEAEEQTKIQRNIETLLGEIKTSRGGAAADVAGRAMIAHGEAIATANNTSENYATASMFAKSLFANVALGEKLKDIYDDPAALISAIVAEPLPEPVGLSLGELANRAGISKAILSSTDENSVRNIAKTYYVLSNILKQVSDNAALFDKNLLQTNLVNYFKSAKTMNDVFVVNATSQKMLMDVFASSFKSKAEIDMVTASQKNATSGYYGIGGDNPRDLKYSTLVGPIRRGMTFHPSMATQVVWLQVSHENFVHMRNLLDKMLMLYRDIVHMMNKLLFIRNIQKLPRRRDSLAISLE